MQRIIVDLPEPEGPQMTMRSPRTTLRLMSRSTWNSPYHLCMPIISTAVAWPRAVASTCPTTAALWSIAIDPCLSAPVGARQPRFHVPGVTRHHVAADEIEYCGEGIAGRARHRRRPDRVDARRLDCLEEIEDADHEYQRRVLEQADIGVDDVRDRDLQRLRQDDEAHHLRIAQAHRHGAFVLPLGDRLQAGAHNL